MCLFEVVLLKVISNGTHSRTFVFENAILWGKIPFRLLVIAYQYTSDAVTEYLQPHKDFETVAGYCRLTAQFAGIKGHIGASFARASTAMLFCSSKVDVSATIQPMDPDARSKLTPQPPVVPPSS